MTEYTTDDLNSLMKRYRDSEVYLTALDLKAHLIDLEQETDTEKKAALTEASRDLASVLTQELRENGRSGEDYINDGVFHAKG